MTTIEDIKNAKEWNDTGKKSVVNLLFDNTYSLEHPILDIINTLKLFSCKIRVKAIVIKVKEVNRDDLDSVKFKYINRQLKGLKPVYLYKVTFVYNDTIYVISKLPATFYLDLKSYIDLRVNPKRCDIYYAPVN